MLCQTWNLSLQMSMTEIVYTLFCLEIGSIAAFSSYYKEIFCIDFENKLKYIINFTKEWLHLYILLILHIEEFNIKRFLKVTNCMV